MSEPKAPECKRLSAVSGDSNKIGAFLDWLQSEREIALAEYDEDDVLHPSPARIEALLAEYFKIDLSKVETERCAILEYIREQNAKAPTK